MSNTNINANSKNVVRNLNTPTTIFISSVILIFVVAVFYILFKSPENNLGRSQQETIKNVMIITFYCFILLTFCYSFLPSFKEFGQLFVQISGVFYVISYTIGLILLFRLTPDDILKKYSFIILPVSMLLGIFMFYKSVTSEYIYDFNINYERIKYVILFFCLITVFITYYNENPGGYITKYSGTSLLSAILVSVFALIYLIILFTFPTEEKSEYVKTGKLGLFSGIPRLPMIFLLLFIIFLMAVGSLIYTYPGGFFNNKGIAYSVIILLLVICILWLTLLILNLYPNMSNMMLNYTKMTFYKKSLLTLFGLIVSGLLISWISSTLGGITSKSNTLSSIVNILLIIVVLSLVYKLISVKSPNTVFNAKKGSLLEIVFNLIFYIPCLFTDLFDTIMKLGIDEYNSNTTGTYLMLLLAIVLWVLYIYLPSIYNNINIQGGKLLINKPISTKILTPLGTYEELNKNSTYDYQYAISFWVYINAVPPNDSASTEKYTSILNYGNKPNVLYKAKSNSLIITMDQSEANKISKDKQMQNKNDLQFDSDGNLILYQNDEMKLQKWNHFILNYNGGILDVFLDGQLVKSNEGIVPYYTLDSLTTGDKNGVSGSICNVVYFNKPLTSNNIYYLYNTSKYNNPPVVNTSNITVIKENISKIEGAINK